jgi:hypothetical protein
VLGPRQLDVLLIEPQDEAEQRSLHVRGADFVVEHAVAHRKDREAAHGSGIGEVGVEIGASDDLGPAALPERRPLDAGEDLEVHARVLVRVVCARR